MQSTGDLIQRALEFANVVLSSGIVVFSAAFLIYLITYSFRSHVARSFGALLACVLVTYFGDLALIGVEDMKVASSWLRLQWLGVAFVPATYLSFSNALLITTGDRPPLRAIAVHISFLLSTLLLLAAIFTDHVVQGGAITSRAPHLLPGPLFPFFVIYFLAAVAWGAANVVRARHRCLTSTSRRRMSYLAVAIAAPAAGVFPYLLFAGWPLPVPGIILWLFLVLGNVAVGAMLVLMAYSVAFFGAFVSDRVVKHRFVRYLLRGPVVATGVVVIIAVSSHAEGWLGLPARRLMIFSVVTSILVLQLAIEVAKPLIDRLLYRQDQPEIEWIQQLTSRLLTTTDLRQFLENVLAAICDLLRVRSGFITVIDRGVPHLEVVCGSLQFDPASDLPEGAWNGRIDHAGSDGEIARHGDLFVWDGFWLVPLYAQGEAGDVLGVVGISARESEPALSREEQAGLDVLLNQAAIALVDRRIQQGVFAALERIIPEIEDIQRRRGMVHYTGEEALLSLSVIDDDEFRQWVWDALSHYWGGPNLTSSPLLGLSVVERMARQYQGNTMQGLRAVLKEAIERLRPDGQREMTTPEWILYNILELKFLQGRKVRDIARRLAMSESDLYRKQRVAIENVAGILADMERSEVTDQQATQHS